jgi:hypothetical protein
MRVDLGDEPEIGLDDASELLGHAVEPATDRALQVGERDRGEL